MYIIVWRNNHKEPFVDTDTHNFLEIYSSYDEAKEEAERTINAMPNDPFYFNYQIYKEQ